MVLGGPTWGSQLGGIWKIFGVLLVTVTGDVALISRKGIGILIVLQCMR